ncbi:MAG: superoxide dismutase family protein [Lautropia sp.]|nr:superoxide dismutase family protein [Lautropia sp.]
MSLKIHRMAAPMLLAALPFCVMAHEHGHQGHDHAGHGHAPEAAAKSLSQADGMDQASSVREAVAVMKPTQGSKVEGQIRFSMQDGAKIRIHGKLSGLKPDSIHGFHVHEKGDCSAPDGTSAGGHFHLDGQQHGGPGFDDNHHAGDLGNIRTDTEGVAQVDIVLPQQQLTLAAAPQNVIGRGLIVHARADDLHSQPTGDAGGRLACGVIEAAR